MTVRIVPHGNIHCLKLRKDCRKYGTPVIRTVVVKGNPPAAPPGPCSGGGPRRFIMGGIGGMGRPKGGRGGGGGPPVGNGGGKPAMVR